MIAAAESMESDCFRASLDLAASQEGIRRTGNKDALLADLKACCRTRNLEKGKRAHAEAVKLGHASDIYVANTLINMYGKCGCLPNARQIFDSLRYRNVVSWNVLILGYAENGQALAALDLLKKMNSEGPAPSYVTFLAVLRACACLADSPECTQRIKIAHNLAMEKGSDSDAKVQNTLIDVYAKCGSMVEARYVFDNQKQPDVVSWNAMILGYAVNGQELTALDLFQILQTQGPAPSSVTFLAAVKACTSLAVKGWPECKQWGHEIHRLSRRNGSDQDIYVQSSLIDMYAKCGSMLEARLVFDRMERPDVVCWNTIILGYADNGQGLTALHLFTTMRTRGLVPSSVTIAVVLKVCGMVGGLEFGRTIHSEIHRPGAFLATSLVDFYAKCGSPLEAQSVFDSHTEARDVVTWTALMAGYSNCGDDETVFALFARMQDAGVLPNLVTFLCILVCCSHAGLVEKGRECLEQMSTKYGVVPTVEHYTAMVDTCVRSNKFEDAIALLQRMPCSPNDVTWTIILGTCCKRKNVEVGTLAFQSVVTLNDREVAAYVLMGQIYESRGMLREQAMVMGMRNKLKSPKISAETCWTNELGEVHSFMNPEPNPLGLKP